MRSSMPPERSFWATRCTTVIAAARPRAQRRPPDTEAHSGLSALALALRMGHVAVERYLLAHGVDVRTSDKSGVTPLMIACLHGRRSIVEKLVQRGAK